MDIFWIETHGNHTADGQARLLYDIPRDQWRTFSGTWELGEDWNAEWIMAYSCDTAVLPTISGLWNMFAGLHLYCGAWGEMWDGVTTDECGEDVADNLTDGDTVAEAWIDGVSDWKVDNHPVVVGRHASCLEQRERPLGPDRTQHRPPVGPRQRVLRPRPSSAGLPAVALGRGFCLRSRR